MRLQLLSLIATISPFALAAPKFTTPAAGAIVPAGTISIAWEDDGTPAIADLSTYTLQLILGGNDATTQLPLTTITATGLFSDGNTVTGTIDPGLAGNTKNGFFLKMTSVATAGGTVINYSNRFTMSGMTGTTAAAYLNAVPDSATSVPAAEDDTTADTATTAAAAAGGGLFTVPYYEQTGPIKYAPMQPVPPTKITAKNYSPLYPTSAYTLATAYMALPSITLTITSSQTFSVSSMENTIAALPQPTADGSDNSGGSNVKRDMANFLQRWKD